MSLLFRENHSVSFLKVNLQFCVAQLLLQCQLCTGEVSRLISIREACFVPVGKSIQDLRRVDAHPRDRTFCNRAFVSATVLDAQIRWLAVGKDCELRQRF
jgi:hypothetical protein